MSSAEINIKVSKNLAEEVMAKAKSMFELREIKHYSEAVREALIFFVKNQEENK